MKWYRLFLYTALTAAFTIMAYTYGCAQCVDLGRLLGHRDAVLEFYGMCARGTKLTDADGKIFVCTPAAKL